MRRHSADRNFSTYRQGFGPHQLVMVLALPVLMLSACGGSSPKSGPPSAQPTTAQLDRDATSSPSATAGGAAAGNPVNGPDFCAFLAGEEPQLSSDGSNAGALADLAISFSSWLDSHAAQKPRTAADLDEVSQASCPATRTKVLGSLGKDSFQAALS
jgi:hypothetical protein